MIYNYSIIAPKGGTAAAPGKTTLKLTHGIVHKLDILFPPGCLALANISIHSALHQVWPTNPGAFFSSDGETISYREFYKLLYEPYELEAWYYNTDDTYDHEITVRIGILPLSVAAPWLLSYEERIQAAIGGE